MFKKKGLIVKVKENSCIIVTRDGAFKRIPRPAEGMELGREVSYRGFDFYPLLKPVILAASILILIAGLTLFHRVFTPEAFAYVSLDINPSLEIAVDRDLRVTGISGFNDAGVSLARDAGLKGSKLNDALKALVQKAITRGYIRPDRQNLMISTIAGPAVETAGLDPGQLQLELEEAVTASGLRGEVRVYPVANEFRMMAKKQGVSPGKFLVYKQVVDNGTRVSLDEVKCRSINNLVSTYQVKLLPNHKKIIIKKMGRHGKPEIFMDDNGKLLPLNTPGKPEKPDQNRGNNNRQNEQPGNKQSVPRNQKPVNDPDPPGQSGKAGTPGKSGESPASGKNRRSPATQFTPGKPGGHIE